MGEKYTTEAISGYNSAPPVDDATQSEANKVKWATHKDKLGDPLKDQIANIDAKLINVADVGPDAKTVNYTTVAGDHQKTLEVTASSVTITLLAVASAPSGYTVRIKNSSGTTVDVDATGSEEIDGSTSPVTLADNETLVVQLNGSGAAYISLQQVSLSGGAGLTSLNTFTKTQTWSKGADIASATALVLGADGNSFDVTGTTTITSIGTVGVGTHITLQFDGALTLTHHTTNIILPGASNITTATGDIAIFYEYASGDWRCINYMKANSGAIIVDGTIKPSSALSDTITTDGSQSIGTSATWTPSQGVYNMTNTSSSATTLNLSLFISSGWRQPDQSGIGASIYFDGSNMRIYNSNAGSVTAWWQRFDG